MLRWVGLGSGVISPLHLPYISPTSPLHLPYISPTSPLGLTLREEELAYISRISPVYLPLYLPNISPISPLGVTLREEELALARHVARHEYA